MHHAIITDMLGEQDADELAQYAHFILYSQRPHQLCVPARAPLRYCDGLRGIVLHREGQFQTQLFIVDPDKTIPEHLHPTVDSYEVYMYGMTFTNGDRQVVTEEDAVKPDEYGFPVHRYKIMRIRPTDWHGGTASKNGGAFMSIQHWLKGQPTSIGLDWDVEEDGEDRGGYMGKGHEGEIDEINLKTGTTN